jgi:phospholipid transport system substrate-binding protein
MCKRHFAIVPLLLLLVAAAGKSPDQEIRGATEQLQGSIKQHYDEYKRKPETFYGMVDQVVVPHFDQRYIGQVVLGRSWRSASESQRDRFVAAFRNSLVHSYADALLENYNTVNVTWKPVHLASDATEATVSCELQRKQGAPIQIGFSVHRIDQEWKVYDVVVDGISLAANFRSQFAAEIKKSGLDALIARLEGGGKPLPEGSLRQDKS